MNQRVIIVTIAACLGCASPSADPCAEAADRLMECGLADGASVGAGAMCDEARAEQVLVGTCEDLSGQAATGKADGWWDAFLCRLGFPSHCPLPAAERVPETGWLTRYDLPGDALHPEGGIFDASDEAFYVGSLGDGSVTRIDARDGATSILSPPDDDDWRTLGMAVDSARRRLFVCAIHDVEPLHGEVWELALPSGERTRHDLTEAADNGSCNDVALSPEGLVYVTDRELPNLYVVDPATGAVELFAQDDLLAPPRLGLGQNGIVVLPDEAGIVTTTYLPPRLQHVALDGTVRRVEVEGDFHDYSSVGAGADGMVRVGDALAVAFSTELVTLRSTDGWVSAQARSTSHGRSGITDLVVAGPDVYLLNGQAVQFVSGSDPSLPFYLLRFDGELP